MIYEEIRYSRSDGVATIELYRPEKLNAWTRRMEVEVKSALRAATTDNEVRAIVLTGSGRGFCAGADMGLLDSIRHAGGRVALPSSQCDDLATENPNLRKRFSVFLAVPKPIIAAINGPAMGLGLLLTLYCDMRFASDRAKFSTVFARLGLVAEHGMSWLLPRIVGMGRASDLLFSARTIGATEALDINLVDRVMPHDRFMADVMSYARTLAAETSPRSLREIKRQLWEAQFQTLEEAIGTAEDDMMQSFVSDDFREGMASFADRRPPKFTGS